jgi:hypothetical protein
MRSAPKSADADSDGRLSRDELTNYYGGGYRQSSSSNDGAPAENNSKPDNSTQGDSNAENSNSDNAKSDNGGEAPRREERRRENRRDDRDRDSSDRSRLSGQQPVKMHEFTDQWTSEKLAEFRELDLNRDGVISVEEFRQRK